MSTVFRVEKTANYTVMSNTHLKDRRLSYKSKGLLSVILSLPPDWDYTITGLAVIAADGVDSVKTAIKELEQYGYVTRTQFRDERGRMVRNEYRVYENPADNPDYVPSEQVSPEQDAPDENAAEHKPNSSAPKIKKKRNFSVSPSAENPSTVTPTTDNPTADTIEKLNINMGTSKNRFEKGKWVECAECDESRRSKAVCLTRRFEEAVGVLYTFSLKQGF